MQPHPVIAHIYLTRKCGCACRHCPAKASQHYFLNTSTDAEYGATMRNITDIAALGIPFIELCGGDVQLIDWLCDAINLCNKLKLYSSISLSGLNIKRRLNDWGISWLSFPSLLRFSIDGSRAFHDKTRGIGCFDEMLAGLDAASKVRTKDSTLLVFTLVPGRGGNINREQFDAVLAVARHYGVKIVINPLFGTDFTRSKDDAVKRWANLTDHEKALLSCLRQQEEVLVQSVGKIDFVMKGGNDKNVPTCKASKALIVISTNNKVIDHCFHNPYNMTPIMEDGLLAALNSPGRLSCMEQAGTHDFCQNCWVWCNIIPSLAYNSDPSLWEKILLGV